MRNGILAARAERVIVSALLGVSLALGGSTVSRAQDDGDGGLITVRQVPPPAPTGSAPRTERALPAEYAQPVGPFTMYMEVVTAGAPSPYGLVASPSCVLNGVYKRGMKLIWRFEVYDQQTGLRVTDRDGASVEMLLPDGSTIPAEFLWRGGPNAPPDAPWTWVAAWDIPLDYPLGPVDYAVLVTTPDGRTGTLRPSRLGSIAPQVVD
jgi:hypothetical protein